MTRRAAARVTLAFLLANACACTSQRARPSDGAETASPTRGGSASSATAAPGDARAGSSGFALANFTGATLRAVYISPSESAGWEENILEGGELADGATVAIRFSPEEKAASWDIRIEAVDNHFAEWKGLRLRDVSKITLLLDTVGELVVAAEVE